MALFTEYFSTVLKMSRNNVIRKKYQEFLLNNMNLAHNLKLRMVYNDGINFRDNYISKFKLLNL